MSQFAPPDGLVSRKVRSRLDHLLSRQKASSDMYSRLDGFVNVGSFILIRNVRRVGFTYLASYES
jgi:hypothetical protein